MRSNMGESEKCLVAGLPYMRGSVFQLPLLLLLLVVVVVMVLVLVLVVVVVMVVVVVVVVVVVCFFRMPLLFKTCRHREQKPTTNQHRVGNSPRSPIACFTRLAGAPRLHALEGLLAVIEERRPGQNPTNHKPPFKKRWPVGKPRAPFTSLLFTRRTPNRYCYLALLPWLFCCPAPSECCPPTHPPSAEY
ncbi:unnamed protein product [Pylaiella littoralis]